IWSGTVQISHGDLEVGNLIAFIEYIFHALFSFMLFASVFMMYPRAAVSASRIQEALDMEPAIREEEGVTETATKGYLEFKNVTFAYPGHAESPVIRNVSFKASPGETVAFIGSTGSGKSTLIRLLNRLIEPTSGNIYIDGQDISSLDKEGLREVRRNKMSMVFQNFGLFPHRTILENTEYGLEIRGVPKEERQAKAEKALENSSLIAFKDQLPSQLSGGMQQRVGLA
ncbi:ATP-binding cassette domain-containing protein, partial [Klebsiella pneumoniae]|uniref:ATP-binding cassette domain-containing protein n=1 Tax=Klebsiella pneumoniae TaxID=573 RepID=UPI0034D22424